jgi:hypothetical protein
LLFSILVLFVSGDHWGDPGIDGRIKLEWIFEKWDVGVYTGWS